jgi:ABC-type transporter Mla maintaining outer membrane lipid asymmetry ATPase subunit MlaF
MNPPASEALPPLIRMSDVAAGSMLDLNTRILEHVNWTVHAGDYWVIAGLQGSGKTDFLMMTGGVTAPVSGQYWLFGEEMPIFDEPRLATRLRLGLVFDGGQLFNHLTVRENVALPLRYHENLTAAQANDRVVALMDGLELLPWADSTPGTIGRNWQKRVGLARALALKPELLLVDNPLGALDFRHAQWWLNFLDQLAKGHPLLESRPVTLVVTTADLRPWKSQARQFSVMRERHLAVLGDWSQLEAASAELVDELLSLGQGGG